MTSLRKLYGNVEGYDFEEEYSIIERTIVHERDVLVHKPTYLDCFRGVNRVDFPLYILSRSYVRRADQ